MTMFALEKLYDKLTIRPVVDRFLVRVHTGRFISSNLLRFPKHNNEFDPRMNNVELLFRPVEISSKYGLSFGHIYTHCE